MFWCPYSQRSETGSSFSTNRKVPLACQWTLNYSNLKRCEIKTVDVTKVYSNNIVWPCGFMVYSDGIVQPCVFTVYSNGNAVMALSNSVVLWSTVMALSNSVVLWLSGVLAWSWSGCVLCQTELSICDNCWPGSAPAVQINCGPLISSWQGLIHVAHTVLTGWKACLLLIMKFSFRLSGLRVLLLPRFEMPRRPLFKDVLHHFVQRRHAMLWNAL